ncbi:helix-turn-helix domain-containing protein [Hyphomonas sp.]|uniref:helix-turn-helix domain-containing protein n=1 Tax=Hyphomonas sp. TaxID=87 RepID=UPI0025BF2A0D|nr:helix-turn-helix domain-containing protein [Hyphomonas sp.]
MKKPKKKRADRSATETDFVVGANVRRLRAEAELTLAELAAALSISHQQLQKYETGANRISAGMLYELARFFAQPVDAFFEGSEDPEAEDADLIRARRKCHAIIERTSSRETLELMAKVIRSMSGD